MDKKLIYYLLMSLSCIGIALGGFLLYEHYHYIATSVCNINQTFNCREVAIGSLSQLFGIPVPFFGLTGYLGILIASYFKANKTILVIASMGFLFCLRITYLEIFQIHVICPVCLACQIDMFFVLCLAIYVNTKAAITGS